MTFQNPPYIITTVPGDVIASIVQEDLLTDVGLRISSCKQIVLANAYLNVRSTDRTSHQAIKIILIPDAQPTGSRKRSHEKAIERSTRRKTTLDRISSISSMK
jgi:hypothetical protein